MRAKTNITSGTGRLAKFKFLVWFGPDTQISSLVEPNLPSAPYLPNFGPKSAGKNINSSAELHYRVPGCKVMLQFCLDINTKRLLGRYL